MWFVVARKRLPTPFALRNTKPNPTLIVLPVLSGGILAGYEDQNDHDALRSDAVFKLLADRATEDEDLASQSKRPATSRASRKSNRPRL
jgi:hypothetical protein